ncbi:hypothetical protein Val02_70070 [Virgisporangium aliadipatigenens]|uniref:EF-hand domain-containing protein n=1 Tax=Virgisporangium aliadipatigenens TaxID=741659 RepID=A0A8J3YUN5_9ACTN|nr:hypothetical protein [Virgisporangium aliadipatigenens]GIJ50121.1 hypothetical protein Val02_70070 [Virgisporangium aliadipatigenens]
MSETTGTEYDVSYEEQTVVADEYGNVFVQTVEVDATAYDFDNDGTVDAYEAEAHAETYAQDSEGNWVYGESDVEVAAW